MWALALVSVALAQSRAGGGSNDHSSPLPCVAWQPPGGMRPAATNRCSAAAHADVRGGSWPRLPALLLALFRQHAPCLLPPQWLCRRACCLPCVAAQVAGGVGRGCIGPPAPPDLLRVHGAPAGCSAAVALLLS